MKSPIISENKKEQCDRGFLIFEAMIAITLFTIFTLSTYYLHSSMNALKVLSIQNLEILKESVPSLDDYIEDGSVDQNITFSKYGNDSLLVKSGPLAITYSYADKAWGGSSCWPRLDFDNSNFSLYEQGISLGSGNRSTDIEVRNSFAYITADSSIQSRADFFIIDATDPSNPITISSLNTGPGLASLAVAGPYAYVANIASVSQLQIIDIHDRHHPHLVSQLKLPLPEASTTPPLASAIFYKEKFIYLGTNKWDGRELQIINVEDPLNPAVAGSFETDTLINDIFVHENKAYLATSDQNQMTIIDISDKTNPILKNTFTSSGWQTQQGKVIDIFEDGLGLGRTVGGINRTSNHEAFVFSSSTVMGSMNSVDIPGGVYGIILKPKDIFLITHDPGKEFQVWDRGLQGRKYTMPLRSSPVAISCDWSSLYFATGDEKGLSVYSQNN